MKICENKHISNYSRKKDKENDARAFENGQSGTCPVCRKSTTWVYVCEDCPSRDKCSAKKTWFMLDKCLKADEVLKS